MSEMSNTGMTLGEFERLLDVYGGDRTRWPAEARAAAAHLVSRDASTHRMLAEAEALDRILERAPLPSLAIEAALADRIVAAAQRSPRLVKLANNKPAAAEQPQSEGGVEIQRVVPWRQRIQRPDVRRAAVLAASLLAGIVIGLSNLPQSVLPGLADLDDHDAYSLAQVEPFDEDIL